MDHRKNQATDENDESWSHLRCGMVRMESEEVWGRLGRLREMTCGVRMGRGTESLLGELESWYADNGGRKTEILEILPVRRDRMRTGGRFVDVRMVLR